MNAAIVVFEWELIPAVSNTMLQGLCNLGGVAGHVS